jgi:hypothetical protein
MVNQGPCYRPQRSRYQLVDRIGLLCCRNDVDDTDDLTENVRFKEFILLSKPHRANMENMRHRCVLRPGFEAYS